MPEQNAHKKSVLTSTPEDIGNPQVNWDRKKFDDLIFDKGYKCYIERAMRCPCTSNASGQGEPNCKNCMGTGWVFIDKQESVVVCSSISNSSKYSQWTEQNAGTVSISCRPQDKLGFMDKVTLIELESWYVEVLTLNQSTTDDDNYFTFTTYPPISVFDIYAFKSSAEPLIYIEDYEVKYNKIIIKKAKLQELGIINNPSITIRYTHNPTYHVIDINRDLIKQKSLDSCCSDDGSSLQLKNFPLHCIGRRAHFILDNPGYNGESVYDNTNYNKTKNYDK